MLFDVFLFIQILESAVVVQNGNEADNNGVEGAGVDGSSLLYCERFAEFLIDLLSQLPTRRFFSDPLVCRLRSARN